MAFSKAAGIVRWDGVPAIVRPPLGAPNPCNTIKQLRRRDLRLCFRVQPIGRVCAQRGFLDVSPWYESAFLSCKIDIQCKRGKRGRMEEGETVVVVSFPLSALRFPLWAFRRVVLVQ